MATFAEGQVIPLTDTNAYSICDGGKQYALTIRMNDGILYRIRFTREPEDVEGSLRAKSSFSAEFVTVPVEAKTQVPGIPVEVETTGDMITGTITFTTHVEP